jgi:hypothetical protein
MVVVKLHINMQKNETRPVSFTNNKNQVKIDNRHKYKTEVMQL